MTTIAAPTQRTPRVLRAGVLAVLAGTGLLVAAAGAFDGTAAVRSAGLGGALVIAFFAFGALNVGIAARIVPSTALLVAMMTYTIQVALVLMVFVVLRRSDAFDTTLTEGWLAAGLIVGTLTWITAQIVTTLRTPIPPWEGQTAQTGQSGSAEEVDAA
ncbi:MAG: hypothetical protein NTV23_13375 [Propionibacteriales bacterium]|nr:hypothetical protein [Propionibacteriales bacterium]